MTRVAAAICGKAVALCVRRRLVTAHRSLSPVLGSVLKQGHFSISLLSL